MVCTWLIQLCFSTNPLALMASRHQLSSSQSDPTRPAKRRADSDAVEGPGSKRLQAGLMGLASFFSFFFFLPMLFAFAENAAPTWHSDRSTKGQGGALLQMQASSEAVQPTNCIEKKKSQARNITDDISVNLIASAPKKHSQCEADVLYIL